VTLYLDILIAIVGLILFMFTNHAKVMEVGRILFFCGVLAWMLTAVPALHVVNH
jgi:Na+/phosphate symporter